jgi:sec-independent protein translocase protein TatA
MFAIFNLGGGEIILILAIVLILFGAKKLPELARGLGQGIKEFKKATDNASEGMRHAIEQTLPMASGRLPLTQPDTQPTVSQASPTPRPEAGPVAVPANVNGLTL